jgi:hypothetical protein
MLEASEQLHRRDAEAPRQLCDRRDSHVTGAPLGPADLYRVHAGSVGKLLLGQVTAFSLRPDVTAHRDFRLHPPIIGSRADNVQSQ